MCRRISCCRSAFPALWPPPFWEELWLSQAIFCRPFSTIRLRAPSPWEFLRGAKLTVALVMVFFLEKALRVSSLVLILAAFVGAMISMSFVLLMSRVLNHMSTLIVSGVMIGYICTAVTDFVVTFADDSDIVNLHNWSQGSFSGISWDNVAVMTVVIISDICLCVSAVQTDQRLPAGRGLCAEHGTEYPAVPGAFWCCFPACFPPA